MSEYKVNFAFTAKMPRNPRHAIPTPLPEAVDIIDLTQDSPSNTALRLPRNRAGHNDEDASAAAENIESVELPEDTEDSDGRPRNRKQRRPK